MRTPQRIEHGARIGDVCRRLTCGGKSVEVRRDKA
jgi:hypothetical protein